MERSASSRLSASIVRPAVARISARPVPRAPFAFSRSRTKAGTIGACASALPDRRRDVHVAPTRRPVLAPALCAAAALAFVLGREPAYRAGLRQRVAAVRPGVLA